MKFASLGTSGIHVSRVCLGTMTFGSPLTEAESSRLVSLALDQGINFFDTADVYEGYSRTWMPLVPSEANFMGFRLKQVL